MAFRGKAPEADLQELIRVGVGTSLTRAITEVDKHLGWILDRENIELLGAVRSAVADRAQEALKALLKEVRTHPDLTAEVEGEGGPFIAIDWLLIQALEGDHDLRTIMKDRARESLQRFRCEQDPAALLEIAQSSFRMNEEADVDSRGLWLSRASIFLTRACLSQVRDLGEQTAPQVNMHAANAMIQLVGKAKTLHPQKTSEQQTAFQWELRNDEGRGQVVAAVTVPEVLSQPLEDLHERMLALDSVWAPLVIREVVTHAWRQYVVYGGRDSELICERGYSELAERLRGSQNSKKAITQVKRAVEILSVMKIPFPGKDEFSDVLSVGHIRGTLSIRAGMMFQPAFLRRIPKGGGRRLVPLLSAPLVSGPRGAASEVRAQDALAIALSKRAEELADRGWVRMTQAHWRGEIYDRAGLSQRRGNDLRTRWLGHVVERDPSDAWRLTPAHRDVTTALIRTAKRVRGTKRAPTSQKRRSR